MKYTKFFSQVLLFSATLTLLTTNIYADWSDESDVTLDLFADAVEGLQHEDQTTRADPNATFNIIVAPEINGTEALKKPFYLTTTPPQSRPLLDLDFFQFPLQFKTGFTFLPFYHLTMEMQFRGDKTKLDGYIDLQQDGIQTVINNANAINLFQELDINDFDTFALPRVLSLFQPAKLQEHRIGIMLQYGFKFKGWNIFLQAPLLYQLRNFYMTDSERKAIENEPLFIDNKIDEWQFAKDHLMSDKFGFGDLRISSEYLVKENYRQFMHFGIDVTLPTSFPLLKGLIGTHFDRKKRNPSFKLHEDLLNLSEDGNTDELIERYTAFATEGLDRLSTILLERKLGEERHVKIGFYVRNQLNFTPDCYLTTKTKLELGIPSTERRFFKIKLNPAELDAVAASNPITDEEALAQFDILNERLIEMIFPQSYRVMVFPGCALQSTAQLTYERPRWTARLGTDAWYHTKEVFGSIEASKEIRNTLDVQAGRLGHALQTRFWIGLDRAHQENSSFDWGVRLSTAGFSYGVGQDFALAFRLTYNF